MSLIRWGEEGSHVYVIGVDEEGQWYQCVGCGPDGVPFTPYSAYGMIAHLLKHRADGDCVPEKPLERLRRAAVGDDEDAG